MNSPSSLSPGYRFIKLSPICKTSRMSKSYVRIRHVLIFFSWRHLRLACLHVTTSSATSQATCTITHTARVIVIHLENSASNESKFTPRKALAAGRKNIRQLWQNMSKRVSPSSPARVSAHGGSDPGKPAWPEHFSTSWWNVTLSQSQLFPIVYQRIRQRADIHEVFKS